MCAAAGLALAACGGDSDSDQPPATEVTRFGIYDWEANVVPNPAARPDRATETPFARRDLAKAACGDIDRIMGEENGGWFALRDRPALTGKDIRDPEVGADPVSNQPTVSFAFSEAGQAQFSDLTAAVAKRGSESFESTGGSTRAASPAELAEHFAVIVNNQIVSRPIVDFIASPAGFDGRNGATITGDFSVAEAEALVRALGEEPAAP